MPYKWRVDYGAAGGLGWASLPYFVGALGLTLWFLWRALKRALLAGARARTLRRLSPNAPLAPGYACVRGTVESEGGDPVVASTTVTQGAVNHERKKSKWHTWDETRRRTQAVPFVLRHPSGELVRVEPAHDALVVDTLEPPVMLSTKLRERTGKITAGESVQVSGQLARGFNPHATVQPTGYRDSPMQGWVLRAAPHERMVLSTEPLPERYKLRARHFWSSVAMYVVALLVLGGWTRSYVEVLVRGEALQLEALHTASWTTRAKNSTKHHYAVTVVIPWAPQPEQKRSFEIGRAAYASLESLRTGPRTLPAVGVPGTDHVFLGTRPTLPYPFAIVYVLGLLGLAAWRSHRYEREVLPWYDQTIWSDHGGSGWIG